MNCMQGTVTPMQSCMINLGYKEYGCDVFMLVLLIKLHLSLSITCKMSN